MQRLRVALGNVQQPDDPSGALDQCADHRALVFADDVVALPVSGLGAVTRVEGPLVDGQHGLCEPGPTLLGLAVGPSMVTPGPRR